MALRVAGVLAAAVLAWALWQGYANYGQFASVHRWTGIADLRWLRGWLIEFRTPLICIAGALGLSALSWIWHRLGLGH